MNPVRPLRLAAVALVVLAAVPALLSACGAQPLPVKPATTAEADAAPATTAEPSPPATVTGAAVSGDAAPTAKRNEKPSQITARHILIQWMGTQSAKDSVVRTRDQALKVAEDVLHRAKSGADFARLAVEFSDEPNAGHRGGSLGRFGHGQMVKQFEDAAFALAPGEISGIVETPFGFHIIQRTE